jgi:hypothetical protein
MRRGAFARLTCHNIIKSCGRLHECMKALLGGYTSPENRLLIYASFACSLRWEARWGLPSAARDRVVRIIDCAAETAC